MEVAMLQSNHFVVRAKERYKLNLNDYDVCEIIKMIKNNETIAYKKISNKACIHCLNYNGRTIKVIYDNKSHTLRTCLPVSDKRELKNNFYMHKENLK
jgi:hypothetical protein